MTEVFIPDTTGLDLREQERYWECVRSGREHEYHGICVNPRHLSWFEHRILKKSRFYDPEQDRQDRLDDLRREWESTRASSGSGAGAYEYQSAPGETAILEKGNGLKSSDSSETAAHPHGNGHGAGVFGDDEMDLGVRRYFEEEARMRNVE